MPFTFFAHQTVVVPLKWARPKWFDGTALCVGSMAPDLAYVFTDTPLEFRSHTLSAQLTWTLPVAVALTLVWRHLLAAPLGAVLPGLLGHEVRALARARRRLVQTAVCAVLGGLSHTFVDGFTHDDGWAVTRISGLRHLVNLAGMTHPLFLWLQYFGHSVGTLVGIAMFALLIKRGRFSAWSEGVAPPRAAGGRLAMWIPIGISAAWGMLILTHAQRDPSPQIIRAAWALFGGLCVGALLTRLTSPARAG